MTTNRGTSRGRVRPISRAARSVRRAFTILEMLITISIIALSAVVILPAFNSALQSANYAAAVNTVTATLGNARALAIQNGEFTAVAFLFDTQTQTYTLLPLELQSGQSASMVRFAPVSRTNIAIAYRPATGAVPVTLPGGTGVYGLSLQTVPLGADPLNEASGGLPRTLNWYAGEAIVNGSSEVTTPWIFPRNDPRHFTPNGEDPYDIIRGDAPGNTADADSALRHAQSFMIQFSPQGTTVDALPGGIKSFPLFNGYIEYLDRPINEFDESTFDPETGQFEPYDSEFAFDPENRDSLGADRDVDENPEVYLRSASLLAVVSFDELRRESGIGSAITAPWFVRPAEMSPGDVAPQRTDLDSSYYMEASVRAISDWIDGNAEIIGFNRYTGTVIRRSN